MSKREQRLCPYCGSEIPPSKGNRPRTWCSSECKWRANRAKRKAYPALRERDRRTDRARRDRQKVERVRWWAICSWCNQPHELVTMKFRCPNEECRKRRATFTVTGRQGERRAQAMGSRVEHFDPMVVYNRDRGLCRRCGMKVRLFGKRGPDTASIDHIVPISAGGEHTIENCQLLCFSDNMRKGQR